ncbi:hypothetical protein [Mycoplasmopsis bovis]|uniref:hypothetical protein n=1 Tax=Mycoplasmopsis bovis TaxID=28903 RepID=UPI001154A4CE|nr:hypothetical protein [Mycoplasmopsis bovis]
MGSRVNPRETSADEFYTMIEMIKKENNKNDGKKDWKDWIINARRNKRYTWFVWKNRITGEGNGTTATNSRWSIEGHKKASVYN